MFLVLAILFLNYWHIENFLENTFSGREEVHVSRIIDGDTVETSIGNVRLLGINAPEKGEKHYEEAKEFLQEQIFNKTVQLEFAQDRKDKYNRILAYIFYNNENINEKIVENGFANYYFHNGIDFHSNELKNAWDLCIIKKVNLCEPSDDICSSCIFLGLNYISNNCSFACDILNWTIKGEGRNKYIFSEIAMPGKQIKFELDLSNSSRSVFLRDKYEKLVLWKSY